MSSRGAPSPFQSLCEHCDQQGYFRCITQLVPLLVGRQSSQRLYVIRQALKQQLYMIYGMRAFHLDLSWRVDFFLLFFFLSLQNRYHYKTVSPFFVYHGCKIRTMHEQTLYQYFIRSAPFIQLKAPNFAFYASYSLDSSRLCRGGFLSSSHSSVRISDFLSGGLNLQLRTFGGRMQYCFVFFLCRQRIREGVSRFIIRVWFPLIFEQLQLSDSDR